MPPAAQKDALLIGNDRNQDLPDLKVPAADVAGLAHVLKDPAIGGFDAIQLSHSGSHAPAWEHVRALRVRRQDRTRSARPAFPRGAWEREAGCVPARISDLGRPALTHPAIAAFISAAY